MTIKRPTSCSAMAAIDPTLGSKGCKRLPRHKGDHRATLHAAPVTKVTPTSTAKRRSAARLSVAGQKRLATKLASAVEAGTLAPSIALSRYSAYVTRLAAKRAAGRKEVAVVIA